MTTQTQRWLTPCYCINLRRAASRLTERYDRALAPLGISVSQYSVLASLKGRDGCGTGELARALHLEKSTLVRTLQPLFKAGLVEDRSAQGSRARKLHLTIMGEEVLAKAITAWKETQSAIKATLGPENMRTLMSLLNHLE